MSTNSITTKDPAEAVAHAERVGYPVVVDVPDNGLNVRSVCRSPEAVDRAFRIALARGAVTVTPGT